MIEPGSFVLLYLQNPKERFWGMLLDLNPSGVVVFGIDINSFEDWTRMVVAQGRNIGLTALFLPMWRVERLLLDRTVDDLLSLQAQFELRVGMSAREYVESQIPATEQDLDTESM